MSNTWTPARTARRPARSPRRWTSALVALVVAACNGNSPSATEPEPSPSPEAAPDPAPENVQPEEPSMSIVRDAAGVAAHDQKVVELVGTYGVTDTGRHKIAYTKPDGSTGMSNKFVRINLDGGAWVDVGVRSAEEMTALKGKTVVATGKLVAKPERRPGPGASPDPAPTLVEIKSIVEHQP